jgi:hypothetical protein
MPLKFDKEKLATPADPTRVPYITRIAEFKYQPQQSDSYDYPTPEPSPARPQAPDHRPGAAEKPLSPSS